MSELGVRLTGDNSEYRSMLSDSAQQGGEFAGKLTEKVGDKLFGLRDISHTVATALGLNLENIAENVARLFTGMTKEEEEFYKKSGELSDQAAALSISNMRAIATEETKYSLLLKERDEALARINKRNEESISIIQAQADIQAVIAKRGAEYTEAQRLAEVAAGERLSRAIDQEKERAATLAANAADEITAAKAVAAIKAADDARAKADQDQLARGEKEWADIRKTHDAEQKKALDEADKVTKDIFDTQSKQIEANDKLIKQARDRAIAEASVLSEIEKQVIAISKMATKSSTGFSLDIEDKQLAAAEAELTKAQNASTDFSNPNYTRDLFIAQQQVNNIRAGIRSGVDYSAMADGALGTKQQVASSLAAQQAADAARENVSVNKRIEASLTSFFSDIGHQTPSLADTSYPSYPAGDGQGGTPSG